MVEWQIIVHPVAKFPEIKKYGNAPDRIIHSTNTNKYLCISLLLILFVIFMSRKHLYVQGSWHGKVVYSHTMNLVGAVLEGLHTASEQL